MNSQLKRAVVGLARRRVDGSILDNFDAMSSALPASRFAFSAAARLAPDPNGARGSEGCLSGKSPGGKHTFRVEANYLGSTINVYDLVKLDQYKDSFKAVHKGAALIGLCDDSSSFVAVSGPLQLPGDGCEALQHSDNHGCIYLATSGAAGE